MTEHAYKAIYRFNKISITIPIPMTFLIEIEKFTLGLHSISKGSGIDKTTLKKNKNGGFTLLISKLTAQTHHKNVVLA